MKPYVPKVGRTPWSAAGPLASPPAFPTGFWTAVVGQVGNLRPIVNRPAGSSYSAEGSPSRFAAGLAIRLLLAHTLPLSGISL
jgi:hypothetical protein